MTPGKQSETKILKTGTNLTGENDVEVSKGRISGNVNQLKELVKTTFKFDESIKIGFEMPKHGCGVLNNNFFITAQYETEDPIRIAFLRENMKILPGINREKEMELMKKAYLEKIAPKVLFETINGFSTIYLDGKNLSTIAFQTKSVNEIALQTLGRFGKINKKKKINSPPNSGLIQRLEGMLNSFDLEDSVGLKTLDLTPSCLQNLLKLAKNLDRKFFCDPNETTIIHGDAHTHNYIFTGLNNLSNDDIIRLGPNLDTSNIKCWLIDYEMATEASYVYDFSLFMYLGTGYPSNCDLVNTDKDFLVEKLKIYLDSLGENYDQLKLNGIIDRYPYCILICSLVNFMQQITISQSLKNSGFDFTDIARREFKGFKSQYKRVFSTKSIEEAIDMFN